MPSETMDQRGVSASPLFHEEKHLTSELKPQSSLSVAMPTVNSNGEAATVDTQWESSLFSSSLSELFSRKLRLQRSNILPANEVEEAFESLKEIEAQTIGNLLPDEDDLFTELVSEVERNSRANNGDVLDDFDLFSSIGGLETDAADVYPCDVGKVLNGEKGANVSITSEHPHVEIPSRTLFVANINSSVEDYELKALFEQYGDICTLHTACKNRGYIVVSYYDIRSALNAMGALQDKLSIHFSNLKEYLLEEDNNHGAVLVNNLDTLVSSGELQHIFSSYGEIKEICKTGQVNHQIYIEFYDTRAAEAALRGLNGSEIAGKPLKLVPVHAEGTRNSSSSLSSSSSSHMGRNFPGIIGSSSINGGSLRNLHRSIGSPVNSFMEHHQNLNVPINSSPLTRGVISASKPIGLQEHKHPFRNPMIIPDLHPHSFPELHDNFVTGSPFASSNPNEGFITSNVIGSPMSENGHRGNRNLWNSSNTLQQSMSSGMMWPNSSSSPHVNTIVPHSLMMNMSSSPVHHHIGSAPVMNSSFWDRRRQPYIAESPESSCFFLGSSPSHPMQASTHRMFPQQIPHMFPGRNPMVSMAGSFDSPTERHRNFSHRRTDLSSSYADKKQYELDLDRILRGEDRRTTLMIKNIPNKYTSKMLLAAIDEHCKGTYDFLYLPIDFKNKCNVGYAFINLIDPQNIIPFHKAFDGKKWEKFNSEKVATLAYARIQGKAALISHFQNSSLMNEDKRCRPILFRTDGPNAGDQEAFPMSNSIRYKPGKPRTTDSFNNQSNPAEELPRETDLTEDQPNPLCQHPI